MDPSENINFIKKTRLINQHIGYHRFKNPKKLLEHLGAIQSQDFQMSKWALGSRLSNTPEQQITQAFNEGKILRTHLLRPTWHLVPATNIRWMLELSAPQIKTILRFAHKELELTDGLLIKCINLIGNALEKHRYLKRESLVQLLEKSGISTRDNRASHIFLAAELEGIICSGPDANKKTTYALLADRAPVSPPFNRKEALTNLASIYFSSRGPATLEDFIWWSGLRKQDAQLALNEVKSNLHSEKWDEKTYWFSNFPNTNIEERIHLLPAFDEYLIAYKNRNHVIPQTQYKKAISNNGIFRPIIVLDGDAIGIWKRTLKRNTANIEVTLFSPINKDLKVLLHQKLYEFALFIDKKPQLIFH